MDAAELLELYQQIILDHNKRPRNFGRLEHPTHAADGHNPLCGDQLHLTLEVGNLGAPAIRAVRFDGEGCAISRASASLMTEAIRGKSPEEARALAERIFAMLTGAGGEEEALMLEFGDMAALAGVRKFPARVKCATLAWHALEAALAGQARISTE